MAGLCYQDLGLAEEARDIREEAKIVAENRLVIIQDNDLLRCNLGTYRVLLGEPIRPVGNTFHLAGALDHQGRVEEAIRIIDSLESGSVFIRSLGPVLGFRDLDAPPYRETLERLEAREARFRDQYGPL